MTNIGISAKNIKKERIELRSFQKFNLKRDLFFVHGWSDEANACWTYPYTETGEDRDPNWEYTIKDWADKLVINKDEKVHYIKLLRDEKCAVISYDKKGTVQLDIGKDETYYYKNFFQFADLLKYKISIQKTTPEIDIVCHSMGGLDSVAAIAVDKESDKTGAIYSPYLKGVNLLITVATPHQGSPAAKYSDTKLAEVLLRKSKYIRTQGANMYPDSPFMRMVNDINTRNKLLDRINFLHMFGGGNDIVVPESSYKIKTDDLEKKNFVIHPVIHNASHSQVEGITQLPETTLAIFKILVS